MFLNATRAHRTRKRPWHLEPRPAHSRACEIEATEGIGASKRNAPFLLNSKFRVPACSGSGPYKIAQHGTAACGKRQRRDLRGGR